MTAALGDVELLNVTLETRSSTLSALLPVGSLGEGMYDLSVQSDGQTSTLADAFTVLPASPVIFSLSPSTLIVGAGDTFSLTLEVQAGTQQVDGAFAYLNFDQQYVQVTNITLGESLPLEIQNQFDNSNGSVEIAAGAINNFPTGTFTLATITFQAKNELTETAQAFNSTMPRISDITFGGQSVMDQLVGSTVSIENATLDGFITLQSHPTPPDPSWSVPLSVTLTIPGESRAVYEFTPTTDENGHFSVAAIEPGTYDVRVKKSTTLRNLVTVTLGAGHNSVSLGSLLEGDADNADDAD